MIQLQVCQLGVSSQCAKLHTKTIYNSSAKTGFKVVGNLAQCIVFVFGYDILKYNFSNNRFSYEPKVLMQVSS